MSRHTQENNINPLSSENEAIGSPPYIHPKTVEKPVRLASLRFRACQDCRTRTYPSVRLEALDKVANQHPLTEIRLCKSIISATHSTSHSRTHVLSTTLVLPALPTMLLLRRTHTVHTVPGLPE